jgi:DNA mismatch repair protein MutS
MVTTGHAYQLELTELEVSDTSLPPMMRQYLSLKRKYPDYLLLFQVGDFYELFYEDARLASQALSIRLTTRSKNDPNPIPMCGVPVHAVDNYIPKLLDQGYSCVLMSQVEESSNKKGMVKREVTRIITPGVRYQGDGINEKEFNYLAAVCVGADGNGVIAFIDVSIGNLIVQEVETLDSLLDVTERVRPVELIIPSTLFSAAVPNNQTWVKAIKRLAKQLNCQLVLRPFNTVTNQVLEQRVASCLPSLSSLSIEGCSTTRSLLDYVDEISFGTPPLISEIRLEEEKQSVVIDAATRRNLELVETALGGDKKNSLLASIDYTQTAMGARLLRQWMLSPSCNIEEINLRLDAVEELRTEQQLLESIRTALTTVRDLERIISRIAGLRATPRDFGTLLESIASFPSLLESLEKLQSPMFVNIRDRFDALLDISSKLSSALNDELPAKINEGGIFRKGYNEDLDGLCKISTEGKHQFAMLESSERSKTGINGLKIKYNNVFGYFIEVTKAHLSKIPERFERKQTLVNAERFVTQELKELEQNVLSAKARQVELEKQLFIELKDWISAQTARMQNVAKQLSLLDVLSSYATVSLERNYSRPKVVLEGDLIIKNGRHPVIESILGQHNFVANDTMLNCEQRRFAVLTGPNMGGKSTYLRQIGLIQLLAQAGSYVPAEQATIGLVDRIFTRIGAADDIARGDSTFMVEMREASLIIKKASNRSLVLIDEIGRGTATTDGLAIATAIAEWLLDKVRCKTVFATHFHELTALAQSKANAFCLAVGIIEDVVEKSISFTHRIEQRVGDRSYGIEVARLAGLPESLLERATQVLEDIERAKVN